jgi:hypothetical protein
VRASVVEDAGDMIAADGEIDADGSLTHKVLLRDAGEVLGDAVLCLIRSRSYRHNLFTLACPGLAEALVQRSTGMAEGWQCD